MDIVRLVQVAQHHAKRGAQAFDALGILGGVRGVLVHDGLLAYKNLDCLQSLCNTHHLRGLASVHEQMGEQVWDAWAQEMMDLLLQGKQEVDAPGGPLPAPRLAWFEGQWSALLLRGEANNPAVTRAGETYSTKRGRVAHSKAYNLAGQALRMSKIRQKVSGCLSRGRGGDDILHHPRVSANHAQTAGLFV